MQLRNYNDLKTFTYNFFYNFMKQNEKIRHCKFLDI